MSRIPKLTTALATTGLFMPGDFPAAAYQTIHQKVSPHAVGHASEYGHFAGAWNAIAYRYNALAECDALFADSISTHGAAPPAEERYRQERDLFGFFSNGFSTFEAFFYGAFAAGALIQPTGFPIATPKEQRLIGAASTIRAYRAAFPSDALVAELEVVTNDPAYMEMRDIRNVLSHRSAPGRTIHIAIGDEPAPDRSDRASGRMVRPAGRASQKEKGRHN